MNVSDFQIQDFSVAGLDELVGGVKGELVDVACAALGPSYLLDSILGCPFLWFRQDLCFLRHNCFSS